MTKLKQTLGLDRPSSEDVPTSPAAKSQEHVPVVSSEQFTEAMQEQNPEGAKDRKGLSE